MPQRLKESKKTVGTRTTMRAIEAGNAVHVFVADDADLFITRRVTELCSERNVEYTRVDTMKKLGEYCGVNVKTACCALVKS